MFVTGFAEIFWEKKSKWDSKKWIYRLILHPIALYEVNRSRTTTWYFAALWFPEKSLQILLKKTTHFFLLIQVFIELFVLHQFPDLGSYKYTFLDFCVTHIWGLIPHILESTAGFIHTFHKVFHESQLYVQMGQKNFLRKTKGRLDDISLPWRQWCSFRPQFIYIMILLVPAAPLTQKTAVFCVPELRSQ